jgi:hypothetical protein
MRKKHQPIGFAVEKDNKVVAMTTSTAKQATLLFLLTIAMAS